RAMWFISHEPGTPLCGTVRFSRRYPTVEKRVQVFNGTSYVPIPEDGPFLKALLFELRLSNDDKDFVQSRDSCSRINKTSVYGLPVGGEELWPVVAFLKSGMIYACAPLVEQVLSPRPALISISGISQGFELLLGCRIFFTQACPFGTLLDANLQNSLDSINFASVIQSQKQPAWKTGTYKGKPQVSISITENLHESVKNNFEFCEVHIPFYNRGPITDVEYKVSFGQLEVFREKSLLVWIIGQKFPKSMEISLSGTISIQHSVQVFASGKPKISTYRKLISSDYYIWNSKAPAPVTYGSLL
ncbi:AP-5 complex subunit mu-1, partial [Galemys pyrenaicus]